MIKIGVKGLIAYEAALKLVRQHRQDLEKRFSRRFMKAFDDLGKMMPEMDAERSCEPAGGLFGTVWRALDLLEKTMWDLPFEMAVPAGCRIDLMKIPVRQEITEICELYNENPYEADSYGAYLVIWEEDPDRKNRALFFHMGDPSLDRFDEEVSGEEIVPIGYITEGKDRLIINGDMIRYLTPYSRQMTDISARKNDRRL